MKKKSSTRPLCIKFLSLNPSKSLLSIKERGTTNNFPQSPFFLRLSVTSRPAACRTDARRAAVMHAIAPPRPTALSIGHACRCEARQAAAPWVAAVPCAVPLSAGQTCMLPHTTPRQTSIGPRE